MQNYFGCFFSLPIVISSIRWNIAGGRKTMVCKEHSSFTLIESQVFVDMCFKSLWCLLVSQVATVMLLFILSGPVKALTYFVSLLFANFPSRILSPDASFLYVFIVSLSQRLHDHCLTCGDFSCSLLMVLWGLQWDHCGGMWIHTLVSVLRSF